MPWSSFKPLRRGGELPERQTWQQQQHVPRHPPARTEPRHTTDTHSMCTVTDIYKSTLSTFRFVNLHQICCTCRDCTAQAVQLGNLLQQSSWTLIVPNTLQRKLLVHSNRKLASPSFKASQKAKLPQKDVHTVDNLKEDFCSQEFKCFDYTEFSYHSIDRPKENKVMFTIVAFFPPSLNWWKDAGKKCRYNVTKEGRN